jgi:hypothetical protein
MKLPKTMKTPLPLIALALLLVASVQSQTPEKVNFAVPSLFEITYPKSFSAEESPQRAQRLQIAKTMLSRSAAKPIIDSNEILDLLMLKHEDSQYAHINVVAGPPELTQEDIKNADQGTLKTLTEGFGQMIQAGYKGNQITVTTGFSGHRITLPDGTTAFLLEHVYKMPDGKIRANQKYYIYTERFTLILGVTISPDIKETTKQDIAKAVSSFKISR